MDRKMEPGVVRDMGNRKRIGEAEGLWPEEDELDKEDSGYDLDGEDGDIPEDWEEPAGPGGPVDYGDWEEPAGPGGPVDYGDWEEPAGPGEPVDYGDWEEPVGPDNPEGPEYIRVPGDSEEPVYPEDIEEPEGLEAPDSPAEPGYPEEPGYSGEAYLDEPEPPEEIWDTEKEETDTAGEKRKISWGVLAAICVFLVFLIGIFLVYRTMYQVEPVFSQVTYELGDQISTDLGDYLQGSDWSVELGELDLSGVDQDSAGTYEAVVRHGREQYLYQITIEDTVPPEILLQDGPVYLAVNRRYTVEDVIAGVQDKDPQVQLSFAEERGNRGVILYEETGSFSCVVVAEDSSGNQSQAVIWVTVDTPPEIAGVQDIYLTMGSEVDYLEHVTATARREGNLTDKIVVDDTGVDLTKEGVYWLSYQVEDSRGIDETCEAKVVVTSARELQDMIGRRQINRNSHRIIGALNLYDGGASRQDDIDDTLEYMRPAFVQLYHRSDTGYSSGSGYIMEITEDQIFICSNRHVVEKYEDWDVYFHDGTKVVGKAVGTSPGYDVGVVALARAEVPEEVLAGLMTVHIDQEYWSGLDDQRIDLGLERIDRQGGILHVTTGSLVKIKQEFEWNDRKEQTEVTVKLEHGDSGSAVVDGHGNLICMAFAYSEVPLRYWCVPLDGILEGYEAITGRKVYVY